MLQVQGNAAEKAKERKIKKDKQKKAREERALKKKERESKKFEKITGKEKRLMQAIDKKRALMIEELNEKTMYHTVEIMNFSLEKGSPKHLAMRKKLHEYHNEMIRIKICDWTELLSEEEMEKFKKTFDAANELKEKDKEERKKEFEKEFGHMKGHPEIDGATVVKRGRKKKEAIEDVFTEDEQEEAS